MTGRTLTVKVKGGGKGHKARKARHYPWHPNREYWCDHLEMWLVTPYCASGEIHTRTRLVADDPR